MTQLFNAPKIIEIDRETTENEPFEFRADLYQIWFQNVIKKVLQNPRILILTYLRCFSMDSPENWSPEVCEFFGLFKICGIYFGIAMLSSVIVTTLFPIDLLTKITVP